MAEDKEPKVTSPAEDGPPELAGQDEVPEIYAVSREGDAWSLTRRSFIAAAGAAAAAAGASACADKEVVIYQENAGGSWQTHVVDKGGAIPAGAVCVCNTVRGSSGTPGQPTLDPTPAPAPTASPWPTGPEPHSTPTPTPRPTCSCVSYTPAPCSCVGHTGCSFVVTYFYPN
jgi:hypothetical protein